MAAKLVVPMNEIQWSITIFILSLGFGQLISAPLADWFARRPLAMAGILIYGLASITSVYSDSLAIFLSVD
jgi:DHA1 family bicyclomycin/chloramphenicol resistance-like MFS transporter